MNKLRLGVITGLVLLSLSSILLVGIVRSQDNSTVISPPKSSQTTSPPKQNVKPTVSGQPSIISIPSLNISLPVVPGYYNASSQTWTLTLDKVQYATITPEPNNANGATFLYGHYRSEVFAILHTIKPDSQAILTTANGHNFYYQLNSISVVNPDDSAGVFNYKGKPVLILQTCTGLFFQNRQLFTFDLEKVT